MTAILELQGLGKNFGGVQAVHDLSFVVNEHEILGLIGPNGAGKSTLFNLVNGVFKPDTGRVIFCGTDVTGEPPHLLCRRGMARTHQIVQPLTAMSVLDNCTVGACFGRENLHLVQAREVARDAATFVGLGDRLTMPASQLTIAGKKRLELARALSSRPTLLLLDEVLAGLNPTEVDHMIDVIRRIRTRGVTIVMIEHLMQAIMSLSHRIVVLNSGQKLAEGSPSAVANDPTVVEAYLGDPKLAEELGRKHG